MDYIIDYNDNREASPWQSLVFISQALFELQEIYENSSMKLNREGYFVENGVLLNCSRKSMTSDFVEYAVGSYYLICIFIFSMMVKRVSYKKDQCDGLPGLVVPMDMLSSHDYIIEYVLVFLALSEEIFNYMFEKKSELGSLIPVAKFFVKIGIVILLSLVSYPIFSAICNRLLIGYGIVLIAAIAYFSIGLSATYTAGYCLVGIKMIPFLMSAVVYSCIDISMVCLFIWKIFLHIRVNGWRNREIHSLRRKHRDYSLRYVRELLKDSSLLKNLNVSESDSKEHSVEIIMSHFKCDELKLKIKEKMYREIHGFSIPPRLMIGIFVGIYFSYRILVEYIFDLTPVAWNMIKNLNIKFETTRSNLTSAFKLVSGNYSAYSVWEMRNSFRYLTFFYTQLLIGCLLCAIFIGFINSIIQSFLLLRNYRLHFQKITRKGFSSLIDIKRTPEPYSLVLGFLRYSGYQAAYNLWGIVVVIFFMFVILYFLFAVLLFPLIYMENSWPRRLLINYGPLIAVTLIFNFIQTLVVKYVFVKEKGKLMEIDNRKAFMIYTHCAFFLNAMMGIFNSLKRVIVWLFSGVFCFSRIDFSSLPDYLHGFDGGYMSYVGFLYTEQYHYNPILQCFVHLIMDSNNDSKSRDNLVLRQTEKKNPSRYRNLWNLAFTLINNEKLLIHRKSFLKNRYMVE